MKIKMRNRSYGYNINKRRPRHGHKYTKYKVSQYEATPISNIGGSIHEKVKQHWGWVGKKIIGYKKSV